MEISRNEFYTLLFFVASLSFLMPTLIPKNSFTFFLENPTFFWNHGNILVQQEREETLQGIQEQAKFVLSAANNNDEVAKKIIADSLTNKKSPFYGVFRISKTTQKLVLAEEPSRPVPLTRLQTRDSDGDIVWQPSAPVSLSKE